MDNNVIFLPSSSLWLYGEFQHLISEGVFKGLSVKELFEKDLSALELFVEDINRNHYYVSVNLQNVISVEMSKHIHKIYINNMDNCDVFLHVISLLLNLLPWYDAILQHYLEAYGYSTEDDYWKTATRKDHQILSRILVDEISKTTCILI